MPAADAYLCTNNPPFNKTLQGKCWLQILKIAIELTYLHLKDPQRLTAQKLASAISERLENFWQWSDLSEGYAASQELIHSCELDENGKVFSPVKTTELVAETYAAAAQIYLYCRLMRHA
jgi:hypothetical protein